MYAEVKFSFFFFFCYAEADYPLGRQGDRLGPGRLAGPGNDKIAQTILEFQAGGPG